MRRIGLLFAVVLLAGATVGGPAPTAQGQVGPGYFATENVEHVQTLPQETDTSGGVFHDDYLYVTTARALTIYDVSDPLNPAVQGVLPLPQQPQFSEEDPDTNGKILLIGTVGILFVVDVEDKTNPTIVGQLQGADNHTISCVLDCKYGWGSEGIIVDLRDPTNPQLAGNWGEGMPAQDGHDVTEVAPGRVVTSTQPLMYLDARKDPLHPKLLGLGANEDKRFIHGNLWPHEATDKFLLVGGESGGDCGAENAGSFMVWDAASFPKTHTFKMLDEYRMVNGNPMEGNAVTNTFCAHWFTTHETFKNGGLVAFSSYEHGVRFLQVQSTGKIKEVGWFLPVGGASSAAYWVTDRIVYSLDYQRGIDIIRFTDKSFYEVSGGGGGGGSGGGAGEQLKGPGVRLRISNRNPRRGDTIRLTVGLRKCTGHKGTKVKLQRKVGGGYKAIGTKKLKRNCVAKFTDVAAYKKATYKAVWPKQDQDHRAGRSKPQSVTPH
ncbi:MAG TPA: hypothetical protein VE174_07800 [Actinomycetota bacterium]|nr:hypothetical protein [Actinomycetota bacterium]